MKTKKLIILLIILIICLSGCGNIKDTRNSYMPIINNITMYLNTIDNKTFSANDIEKNTKSKYVGDIGSGITIMHFEYDAHLSFNVSVDNYYNIFRCTFEIDNEFYCEKAI